MPPQVGDVGEFPQHDGGGTNLDQAVETETCERDRPSCHGRESQDDNADHIPTEGHVLETAAGREEQVASVAGVSGRHGPIFTVTAEEGPDSIGHGMARERRPEEIGLLAARVRGPIRLLTPTPDPRVVNEQRKHAGR